jgi:hypothetical protein
MAKKQQEHEQERARAEKERKQLEEEREEARKRHEEEKRILEEARRKENDEKRKVEEMEEIEKIKEATRVEEERVRKEKEHLEQMHQLELKQREADETRKKEPAPSQLPVLKQQLRPTPRPKVEPASSAIDDPNLSPWQREIMNRYKSKEKTNFVVVREVENRPLQKQTSSHAIELEQLAKADARKSSVSQILQRFEQKSSPNELPLSARKK